MRAKEVLTKDRIEDYYNSVQKMQEMSIIESNRLTDFSAFIDENNNFFISTSLPIPSARCSRVELAENDNQDIVPIFYYKILIKGSFEKEFKDFLFNGAINTFSFYNAVYNLEIFKDKPRKYKVFQISFDSLNKFYDILKIQRNCDFRFRIDFIDKNRDQIISEINKYNEAEEKKKNLSLEITKSKNSNKKLFYSINEELTLAEAKYRLSVMKRDIKLKRKNLIYPNFVESKNGAVNITEDKSKIVSFSKNQNGDFTFYYY